MRGKGVFPSPKNRALRADKDAETELTATGFGGAPNSLKRAVCNKDRT